MNVCAGLPSETALSAILSSSSVGPLDEKLWLVPSRLETTPSDWAKSTVPDEAPIATSQRQRSVADFIVLTGSITIGDGRAVLRRIGHAAHNADTANGLPGEILSARRRAAFAGGYRFRIWCSHGSAV